MGSVLLANRFQPDTSIVFVAKVEKVTDEKLALELFPLFDMLERPSYI